MRAKQVFLLLLLISPHALTNDLIFDFIGTWELMPTCQSQPKSYVIYHFPHRYTKPVSFCIRGHDCIHSEDIYYGRYDVIAELTYTKVILLSGIWFHPVDLLSNEIYDIKHQDIDLENFKFPSVIEGNPLSKGIAKTQILTLDNENFIYQDYNPESHKYDVCEAKRSADISLDEIKRLPYHDEL